jgi:hypothetical protein
MGALIARQMPTAHGAQPATKQQWQNDAPRTVETAPADEDTHPQPPWWCQRRRPTLRNVGAAGQTVRMTQPTKKKTGKAAAAAAAKTLLADRIALVTALGGALDVHSQRVAALEAVQVGVEEAAELARVSYAAALAGGWSVKELTNAGLLPPPALRTRKTKGGPTTPAATEPSTTT